MLEEQQDKKVNDKYKGIKPEIAQELEKDEILYFREDKPVPFCGLLIYPIQVRDYEAFCACTDCLTLNRKESVIGLSMNDLDFLLYQTQDKEKGAEWSYKIQKLFELVFHIENGIQCQNSECQKIIRYESKEFVQYIEAVQKAQKEKATLPQLKCPNCGGEKFNEVIKILRDEKTKYYYLVIQGHKIMPKDFELFRRLVMFQNMPGYRDDSWVDPELRKDYETKLELQNKKNNFSASIERKVIGIAINTNYKFDEIFSMSIRKFTTMLSMIDELIDYKITKTAMMSGFVSAPKDFKLEHWLYKSEKDMYGDAYKDYDTLKQEVSNL